MSKTKPTDSLVYSGFKMLARCASEPIQSATVVAYEDLGAEAVRRLEVVDFPLTVVIDSHGNNLYETGPAQYLASLES